MICSRAARRGSEPQHVARKEGGPARCLPSFFFFRACLFFFLLRWTPARATDARRTAEHVDLEAAAGTHQGMSR